MLASIVIRTYNEERYLSELLGAISRQKSDVVAKEIVIVDSGSTDATLQIAKSFDCRITHIKKSSFTFGRSLNVGCEFARGDFLVFVSGHCIPASDSWLSELCKPLVSGAVDYVYGRQIGRDTTKYSEGRHFARWFPEHNQVPQSGFFCNNANAAVTKAAWQLFKFNEELTGLEDMYLAKLLLAAEKKIGYVGAAPVFHIHDESWKQVRIRYEREALALQKIMPEVAFNFWDFMRYFIAALLADWSSAIEEGVFLEVFWEIVLFRFNQYRGTLSGSRERNQLSESLKRQYFYPLDQNGADND